MDNILQDLSDSRLIEAFEANPAEFFAYMGRSPRVELYNGPDMVRFISGIPFPLCNDVFCVRLPETDLDARIEGTLSYFKARQLPMFWWTGPTTRPSNLGERLQEHGLVAAGSPPGMAAGLQSLPELPMPPGFTVRQVRDEEGLEQLKGVLTAGFDLPEFVGDGFARIFADVGFSEDQPLRNYIGLADGEPVTASTLFLGAGVAGIYNVATLPQARGKGYGAAVTLEPLCQARKLGYRVGMLHASGMGYNVYRHLGFEEYCKMGIYAWLG